MEEIIVENKTTEVQEKKWKFRQLKGKDIFLMLPILKKIGINNIKKCWSGDIVKGIVADKQKDNAEYEKQVEAAATGAMLEFAQILIEGLDNCENEIFNLLEKTSNLSRAEIEDLSMVDLPTMIIDFVKKDEFKDFLKVAQSYIK